MSAERSQSENIARLDRMRQSRLETDPEYALRNILLELSGVAVKFSPAAEDFEEMQRLLNMAKAKFEEVD